MNNQFDYLDLYYHNYNHIVHDLNIHLYHQNIQSTYDKKQKIIIAKDYLIPKIEKNVNFKIIMSCLNNYL